MHNVPGGEWILLKTDDDDAYYCKRTQNNTHTMMFFDEPMRTDEFATSDATVAMMKIASTMPDDKRSMTYVAIWATAFVALFAAVVLAIV